jgi:predicted alpha/beta-fold hydrolase
VQGRRRDLVCTVDKLNAYLATCTPLSREEFYHAPEMANLRESPHVLAWDSPIQSGFPANDRTKVLTFCPHEPGAPMMMLLHALMSASDGGYRKVASWFNDRGWNVVFPHLPYHYSRKPAGYFNGELAISADLVRNAETIRQGVIEQRQLMNYYRAQGTTEFALIGTSLGG